jgi:hypothetical protein
MKKYVIDYLVEISRGEGFQGQEEIPFGLMEREVGLPIALNQMLVFFRGARRGLAEA